MALQKPQPGVKDLPSVPGSLNHNKPGHKAPALGEVGMVPDKNTPESTRGGKN